MPRATQGTTIGNTTLPVRGYHPLRPQFPLGSGSVIHQMSWPYNPVTAETATVWAAPISLAATFGITLVFLSSAYLDVSVQRVDFHCWMTRLQRAGLPHSDTHGSMLMCSSPRIIAAYRVLLRLWEPRHPPCALLLLVALFIKLGL